jgi:myo-inositol-1(or 4)-monophosphatase
MSDHEPQGLRDLAERIAVEAATLVRERRVAGVTVADTKSSVVDVVTEADRAAEELVRQRLAELRRDDAVLGEEGEDRAGTTGVRWVVDPIDGTVNYLYGLPEYAVSLAAEVDGEVVAGVVVNAATGAVYAAARGHGATRDGVPLRVRTTVPLAQRLVLTGFGYRPEVRAHQGAGVARLLPRVRDIRRMGSCALDLCHVAEGTADAYVEEGPQPWDWAAGSLVAREAGARFALLPGMPSEHLAPIAGDLTGTGGWPDRAVVTAAPEGGWADFVTALVETGLVAPEAADFPLPDGE